MDEMHLWGANIGKYLWTTLITDDSPRKFDISNPLFLPNEYRQLLGHASKCVQSMNPINSHTGDFLGNFRFEINIVNSILNVRI
jgi:hypothetical protein